MSTATHSPANEMLVTCGCLKGPRLLCDALHDSLLAARIALPRWYMRPYSCKAHGQCCSQLQAKFRTSVMPALGHDSLANLCKHAPYSSQPCHATELHQLPCLQSQVHWLLAVMPKCSEPSAGSLLTALLGSHCDGQGHLLGALGSPQQERGSTACVNINTILLIIRVEGTVY